MRFSRVFLLAVFAISNLSRVWAANVDVVFYDNRFGQLDDVTGDYRQIGTLPMSVSSGIAYLSGSLYLEDAGANLYTVDGNTGVSRLVGATGVPDTAAVFAGGVNGLFEVDFASNLYRIDPGSGKGQLVGPTGLAANNGGQDTSLSSDGVSLYYTAGAPGTNDELFRINITTGVAMDLGNTGVTAISGSAYVDGNLELYQYGQSSNSIFSARAGSINFARQSGLSVQALDGGAVLTAPNQSSLQPAATPEPSTMLLLGGGLIFLGFMGRRRKPRVGQSPKP